MLGRDSRQARIDTLIGPSAQVHGGLTFAGGLHLDGRIAGDVRAEPSEGASLSVSATGCIDGAVEVPIIMLNGSVKGDIVARTRIVLGATARVHGNVHYGIIEMAPGAQILGKLTRIGPERTADTAA